MFCLTISSFLHVTPRLPSLFSLVLPFPEGPSLNPRESGRSQGWRGRAGNPRSDPGQFNYPVFFRCTTRVPISQPTPLMRPGLASLTFNDLPIDALGPPHTGTQTHIFFFISISFFLQRNSLNSSRNAGDQKPPDENMDTTEFCLDYIFVCLFKLCVA